MTTIHDLNPRSTVQAYRGKGKRRGKRNKYHAIKTTLDGITFDSKREAARYTVLKAMQATGAISGLECQPKFVIQAGFKDRWSGKRERAITYTADFRYKQDEHTVVEDVKSTATAKRTDFRMKWKLVKHMFPDVEFKITE